MLELFFICGLLFSSCSNNIVTNSKGTTSQPSVTIKNATTTRVNSSTKIRFNIDLSSSSTKQVSVRYTTKSGTAKADSDYKSKSGTLTFQPGNKEKSIDVPVKVDSLRQPDQKFYVQLSDPTNATLKKAKATGTIINNGTYLPTDSTGYSSPKSYAGYTMVWHDEFNHKHLNTNIWNYETGGGGWGNHELENYTSRTQNSFLSSGNLIISARKEKYGGNDYTSARLTTQNKKSFKYGRIDIRAKLPVAQGLWPALWMLGNNISSVNWPACGEIDIMELIGKNPKQVHGSLHWKKQDESEGSFTKTYSLSSDDFSQKFHVFSLIWNRDSLKILVDNKVYASASRQDIAQPNPYPFDQPFFLIFNVAVGGSWPGPPDSSTQFPQRMFVDYVRVFQKN